MSASGAITLVRYTCSSTSRSYSSSSGWGLGPSKLALLTSASNPPNDCAACASSRRWAAPVTSPAIATTRVRCASSARAASSASAPRASRMSCQPSAASWRASASPSPREAPVIKAVRDVCNVICRSLFRECFVFCCHYSISGVSSTLVKRPVPCCTKVQSVTRLRIFVLVRNKKVEVIANMIGIGSGQRRIGKYELYKRMAINKTEEIWIGRDPQSRSYAIVKVFYTTLHADSDAMLQFRQQVEQVAALHHPNIARIYDLTIIPSRNPD